MPSIEALSQDTLTVSPSVEKVYRVDVLPLSADRAEWMSSDTFGSVLSWPVYWFSAAEIPLDDHLQRIAEVLLIDPIMERAVISSLEAPEHAVSTALAGLFPQADRVLEKQFLPGVTDNLASTVRNSLSLLLPGQSVADIAVASGRAYAVQAGGQSAESLVARATYQLFNPLVERLWVYSITDAPADTLSLRYRFPKVGAGLSAQAAEVISLAGSDAELMALSRERNLALTLDEMKVIQAYFARPEVQQARQQKGLPVQPVDIELEILAQTWSEHCKHKIFAAQIDYTDASDPKHVTTTRIDGLFKTYIAGSTNRLLEKRPDLLSVFKDNAGVVRWNEDYAVCFKVETHNSPSALEPYGGALTGIVGVNRDILGTGLGAKPLFNTDVFCFAHPDEPHLARPKMLPPEAILQGVRKGVEDGGNKSGIPTVNGSLFFDPRYRAKPLVFCGTGGLLPLDIKGKSGFGKFTQPGDTIVMLGGRVGKDGIHGATFSSEAMHQDSPVSAVQIGDPLTQKRLSDFLWAAQAQNLITGITDNGAGGLSSSVGEMAQLTHGASINLENVPLKYPGLAPYEIVISESQERMTLSTRDYPALLALAQHYDVEVSDIGTFHDRGTFDIYRDGRLLASLDLDFLHDGLPQMQLEALWELPPPRAIIAETPADATPVLLEMMAHPNICSREALIRQYDHEVQGRSVIKPLMGPRQTAPCDAAVLLPILDRPEGLVVSNGMCPQYSDWDGYAMATCAADEAVRNAVAVGADPASITLLDNFCWPDPLPSERNPDASHKLAQLVRANQGLYDLTLSYEMPLISGKDSMKNDFDDGECRISIPPTLLVSAMGKIPDAAKAVSMEFKRPGDRVFLLGKTSVHMGGSQYYRQMGWYASYCPRVDMNLARRLYGRLFECMQQGWIRSCHDLSEGGLGVALAECALGGGLGASVSLEEVIWQHSPELRWDEALFSESPSRFVISVAPDHAEALREAFEGLPLQSLGQVTENARLSIQDHQHQVRVDTPVDVLLHAWSTAPAACYAQSSEETP